MWVSCWAWTMAMATLRQARWLSHTCIAVSRRTSIDSLHRVQPMQLLHSGVVASSSIVCPPATAAVYETLGSPDQVLRLIPVSASSSNFFHVGLRFILVLNIVSSMKVMASFQTPNPQKKKEKGLFGFVIFFFAFLLCICECSSRI